MAGRDPKVSVILPTHNRAHFLGAAIESVLTQTVGDLELIVVDDGSTDDTAAVLAAIRDVRLRCVRQEHRGVAAAANAGIRIARGQYIARIDSDDVWLPELLDAEVAILDARPEIGVVHARCEAMDRDGKPLPFSWGTPGQFPGESFRSMLCGDFVCNVTMVARRACFERAGLHDESLRVFEDWHLRLRVARHFEFAFVDRVLARVRRHESNITGPSSPFHDDSVERRAAVLDLAFRELEPDLPAAMRRLKPIAYRNMYVESGLHQLGAAEYGKTLHAFRRALACGANPVTTSARIVASSLAWYVVGRKARRRHVARVRGLLGRP